jgi:hypothetical protein
MLRTVDRLPEALLSLTDALAVTKALSVGYPHRSIAIHMAFNANDTAVYAQDIPRLDLCA